MVFVIVWWVLYSNKIKQDGSKRTVGFRGSNFFVRLYPTDAGSQLLLLDFFSNMASLATPVLVHV